MRAYPFIQSGLALVIVWCLVYSIREWEASPHNPDIGPEAEAAKAVWNLDSHPEILD